jgi:hypothetical protein
MDPKPDIRSMSLEFADRAADRVIQSLQRSVDGEIQRLGVMSDCNGCEIGHARFEDAALVRAAFAGVHVAQMHFHSCNSVRELGQGVGDGLGEPLGGVFDQADMVVVIDLYLHAIFLRTQLAYDG